MKNKQDPENKDYRRWKKQVREEEKERQKVRGCMAGNGCLFILVLILFLTVLIMSNM